MKTLICDDDKTSLFVLEKMLDRLGVQALKASDGVQAWNCLNQEHPSLIITDLQMPNMDGLELCKEIREHEALKDTYIILVTAFRDQEKFRTALSFGADDFISKPFESTVLALRLHVAKRVIALNERIAKLEATLDNP